MALTRVQKQKILEELKANISRQAIMIFVAINGLKVKDLFELRKRLKGADSVLKVVKKTLIGLAFKEKGVDFDKEKLEGETAIMFGWGDIISPAKILLQFSKERENLKILGGIFENQFKAKEEIIALAQFSSREEIFARLVGGIKAPVSGLVSVLGGNIKGLILALSAIKK